MRTLNRIFSIFRINLWIPPYRPKLLISCGLESFSKRCHRAVWQIFLLSFCRRKNTSQATETSLSERGRLRPRLSATSQWTKFTSLKIFSVIRTDITNEANLISVCEPRVGLKHKTEKKLRHKKEKIPDILHTRVTQVIKAKRKSYHFARNFIVWKRTHSWQRTN